MNLCFNNSKISAISAVAGKNIEDNLKKAMTFTDEVKAKKIIKSLGFKNLRYTDTDITTADLCIACANNIFSHNIINREDVDALIFITQTPDSLFPATSFFIQKELQLSKNIFLYDLTLGCSGYVYGLLFANQLIASGTAKNVLLCCGDTSRTTKNEYNQPANTLLFGDAGSCTLVQHENNNEKSYFSCYSNGDLRNIINNDAFSFRKFRKDPNINLANYFSCQINGLELANFTMNETKNEIIDIVHNANLSFEDISYCIAHQANKNLLKSLALSLGQTTEFIPFLSENTGNTSSASIPIGLVENKNNLPKLKEKPTILSGFGVGLSVVNAIVNLKDTQLLDPIYM